MYTIAILTALAGPPANPAPNWKHPANCEIQGRWRGTWGGSDWEVTLHHGGTLKSTWRGESYHGTWRVDEKGFLTILESGRHVSKCDSRCKLVRPLTELSGKVNSVPFRLKKVRE